MIHAEHSHVGAPARAALGNLAERFVIDPQKPNRAGCHTLAGADLGSLGTQP